MRWFRDLSIRHKFTLLLLGVIGIVVLAVSVANVVGEVQNTRVTMAEKYSTLAKIVAAQGGAALSIADVDDSGAKQIVADLAAEPSIRFAALIDAGGDVVASYSSNDATSTNAAPSQPAIPRTFGAKFTSYGFLDVVEQVELNGAVIGRIYLRAATTELNAQVRRIVLIAVVVYVIALAFGLLLSLALQRFVSAPILQLAELTRRVSVEHNYGLTADNRSNDELGTLCDGFNKMLAEIRRRDDDLEESNNELLQSNDELRQFAYVASHDLQEPLRSISSFCDVLKEECGDSLTEDANQYVGRIVAGATRMRLLITDLLSYSRVSRDEQNPFTLVDVHDVVSDVLANLAGSISASGAEVTWDDLPSMHCDRMQMVQLLQNLVGNAILYRRQQPPHIEISAAWSGDHWQFAVRDDGIGVAPEHRDRIFEIFKRLHGRGEYPGAGIGLAVCRKIVQRHGGRIWVESILGQGSVFRFTIHTPCIQEESHEHSHQIAAAL